MNAVINRRSVWLWIVITVLILGLGYWYIVRPYVVTKGCHQTALDNTGYDNSNAERWIRNDTAQKTYAAIYEVCLHKEGVNP